MKGIVLDENCNLKVAGGSLIVGDNRYQRGHILTIANKGEIKAFPTVGFGAGRWIKRAVTPDAKQQFVQGIEAELRADKIKARVTIPNERDLNEFYIEIKD